MKPPTFLSGIEPLKAETWLFEIEKLFKVLPYFETQKVLLAIYTLKDEARRWWLLIQTNNGNMTWTQFNEIFYDKYFPQCFRDRKVFEFQELKQGRMSVAEYGAKFTELAHFFPHMVDTDYKKARKFEGGLDLDGFDRVDVLKLSTYVEVLDRALMAEAILATKKQAPAPTTEWKGKRSKFNFKNGRSFSKRQNTGSSSSSSQSSGSVSNCPDCGIRHKGMCHRVSGTCFRCGKTGHMIRDCPLRFDNANRPATSSVKSAPTTRTNARTDTKSNTGNETLRQMRVFALVPGDVQNTESVVSACDTVIGDMALYVDLLPLSIDYFDCILGMYGLTKYYATINCVSKSIVFRPPGMPEFVFTRNGVVHLPSLISFMKARKLLRKGCRGYLCCILTATSDSSTVENISVVNEFPDAFPNDLPGELIDREIEFTIDVVPETQSISKTPYRISTFELKELKA
ncbi:uncharacterized protein LOC114266755 [Camellia sinensis]|uniref:uncharacterized protein LOC114266755 n=1 Tax=Camellia sinensis TaxID=4442 RepID=UPI001036BED9|nr:uncharacterized protein LOC114266755 [Camellia sinensis]